MSPSPATLLRRYLDALPNVDAVRELLHPDVSFTLFAKGGRVNVGRERILGGLEHELNTFYQRDTFVLNVIAVFGDDANAAARFQINASTVHGPYSNNYAIIARFVDGLLVEAWEYVDSASARDQLRPPAARRDNK